MALHKGQLETTRQLMAQRLGDTQRPVPWTKTDIDAAALVVETFLTTNLGQLVALINRAGTHNFSPQDVQTLLGIVAAIKERGVGPRPDPTVPPQQARLGNGGLS